MVRNKIICKLWRNSLIKMNNGMMVSMWGPPGWKYLHSVAHGYPVSPSEYDLLNGNAAGSTESVYKTFFSLVGKTLPCRLCRESYSQFVRENPVRTGSREELTRWLWEIHNKVNDKLGRAQYDFDSTSNYYESFRAKCSNSKSKGCTEPLHPVKSLLTSTPIRTKIITVIFIFVALLYLRMH